MGAAARRSHHLILLVNAVGDAAQIAWQLTERPHAALLGPDECLIMPRVWWCGSGQIGKAHHGPVVVDGGGSIPGNAAEATQINGGTVFPHHCATGAEAANRNITTAGNPDYL